VPEAAVPTPNESNCTSLPVPKPMEVLAVAPDSVTKVDPFPTMKFPSVVPNPAIFVSSAL